MALSAKAKLVLKNGLGDEYVGKEIADALDTGFAATPAAHIAPLGALDTVGPPVGVGAVDDQCALAADVNASIVKIDARIATLQAKLDALLAAEVVAGLMAP